MLGSAGSGRSGLEIVFVVRARDCSRIGKVNTTRKRSRREESVVVESGDEVEVVCAGVRVIRSGDVDGVGLTMRPTATRPGSHFRP